MSANWAEWLASEKQVCHTKTFKLVHGMLLQVMCVWNQWIEEGCMQKQAGTVPCKVTKEWDDHHFICMIVMSCTLE